MPQRLRADTAGSVAVGVLANTTGEEALQMMQDVAAANPDAAGAIAAGVAAQAPEAAAEAAKLAGAAEAECWNCGDKNYNVRDCPKPKDQARIKKSEKAWEKKVKEARNQGAGNSSNTNAGKKKSSTGGPGPGQCNRKHWQACGLAWMNGSIHMKCKTCGWNTTHSTKYHNAWEGLTD